MLYNNFTITYNNDLFCLERQYQQLTLFFRLIIVNTVCKFRVYCVSARKSLACFFCMCVYVCSLNKTCSLNQAAQSCCALQYQPITSHTRPVASAGATGASAPAPEIAAPAQNLSPSTICSPSSFCFLHTFKSQQAGLFEFNFDNMPRHSTLVKRLKTTFCPYSYILSLTRCYVLAPLGLFYLSIIM